MNLLDILAIFAAVVTAVVILNWFLDSEAADFLICTEVNSALTKRDLFAFQRRVRIFCKWLGRCRCIIEQEEFDKHNVVLLLNRKDYRVDESTNLTEEQFVRITEKFRCEVLMGFEQYFQTISYKVSFRDNIEQYFSIHIHNTSELPQNTNL